MEPKISAKPIAEKGSSYQRWVEGKGNPSHWWLLYRRHPKVPLEPWKRTGGLAARICLEGTGDAML
jgi:hypothetical protein